MANGNTQDGRATKAERKDEARRRRIELERKMARARRNRTISIALAVVVVAAVAVFALTRPEHTSAANGRATGLLASSTAQAAAAGCTDVQDVGPYQPEDQDRAHIGADGGPAEMPALSTYPSVPLTSGPHADSPLAAGVYPSAPPMDQLIHSLEHGAAIVWYDPNASGTSLTDILDFYRDRDVGSRVIVAPYDYPAEGTSGSLPADTGMALVSWHRIQTCTDLSLAAAFGFTARYAAPSYPGEDYLGDAPEPGAAL